MSVAHVVERAGDQLELRLTAYQLQGPSSEMTRVAPWREQGPAGSMVRGHGRQQERKGLPQMIRRDRKAPRCRALVAVAAVGSLVAAVAAVATSAPTITTVMTGLNSPRGLGFAPNGDPVVVEAGNGAVPCVPGTNTMALPPRDTPILYGWVRLDLRRAERCDGPATGADRVAELAKRRTGRAVRRGDLPPGHRLPDQRPRIRDGWLGL